jgi:regulator of protease activity HflC (stomatin/prohibitin superfamily)
MRPQDYSAPIIEEVDEDELNNASQATISEAADFSGSYNSPPQNRSKKSTREEDSNAIVIADNKTEESRAKKFMSSIKNTVKAGDDSSHSFADNFVPGFGDHEFNESNPEPSAPPMDETQAKEYETWLRAQSLQMRMAFPQHKKWQAHLKNGGAHVLGENPVISLKELPEDTLSASFLQDVVDPSKQSDEAIRFFTGNGVNLPSYSEKKIYIPRKLSPNNSEKSSADNPESDWETVSEAPGGNNNNSKISLENIEHVNYDEISAMIKATHEKTKKSYAGSFLGGTQVAQNHFIVLADKNGAGNRFQIWGDGFRVSLSGLTEGHSLDYVSKKEIPLTTDYFHVPNRFTIVRIQPNEVGFLLSRKDGSEVLKLLPGRYFIAERLYAYMGKAQLQASQVATAIKPGDKCEDASIKDLAQKIKILSLPVQHIAFVKQGQKTFILPYREEPYILDERRGEFFLNFASMNEKLIQAQDKSYTIVNQLLPGEFLVFQYNSNEYVWQYSPENPELNTLHLPSTHFRFDGKIHNTSEDRYDGKSLSVIALKPSRALVLQDPRRNIRFMEENADRLIVLRMPWKTIEIIPSAKPLHQIGRVEEGCNITRAVLKSNEWALTINREGRLQLVAPSLEGAQYFRQPEQSLHAIIDKNKEGEQKFEIPGFGKVSVVNLVSGTIGACRLKNTYFFIGPKLEPYIFSPPNEYIRTIDIKETRVSVGDLHRIYLKPEERAAIDCDGQLIELPMETQAAGIENLGNGIYVFRARNLNLNGPAVKGDRHAKLTPIEYINVGVGEVGYGYVNGAFKIWGPGEHKIDNRKQEWFKNFFSTSVDPVNIKDFKITSKHTVTSHIDVFVSYTIVDPRKALESFSNADSSISPHDAIHEYISSTTKSEVLNLCSTRPPIGYTDLDFDAKAKSLNIGKPPENKEDAIENIQSSFEEHVLELFEQKGIKLSRMRITRWDIDPEFVKKSQENAIRLQDERSKNEQEQILLERQKIESEKKLNEMDNKVELGKKQNLIKLQEMEFSKQQTVLSAEQEGEVAAAKQIAEAKARAEMAKADAQAKIEEQKGKLQQDQAAAESARLVAEKAIETEKLKQELENIKREAGRKNTLYEVETEVQKRTAGAVAEAEANAKISESQLLAVEATSKVAKVKADTKKYEGMVDAEIEKAKNLAKNPDLSPEQRTELQLWQMRLEMMRGLTEALLKSQTTLPGLLQLNPDLLGILGMQGLTQTTTTAPVTTITQRSPNILQGGNPFAAFPLPQAKDSNQGHSNLPSMSAE